MKAELKDFLEWMRKFNFIDEIPNFDDVIIDEYLKSIDSARLDETKTINAPKESKEVCKHPYSQRRFSHHRNEQCGVCRKYL